MTAGRLEAEDLRLRREMGLARLLEEIDKIDPFCSWGKSDQELTHHEKQCRTIRQGLMSRATELEILLGF